MWTSISVSWFDIHGLGSQLKPTGLLVITDTMLNRVTLNWKKGKRTHVFIDEFHVVFENEFSAQFFNSAWRQFRKRNAYLLQLDFGFGGKVRIKGPEKIKTDYKEMVSRALSSL